MSIGDLHFRTRGEAHIAAVPSRCSAKRALHIQAATVRMPTMNARGLAAVFGLALVGAVGPADCWGRCADANGRQGETIPDWSLAPLAAATERDASSAMIRFDWSMASAQPEGADKPVIAGESAAVTEPPEEPAGNAKQSDVELAKKLSNPVASLISVPFQFNYDTGLGPKDADRITLNIQPVIPFSLTEDWNLIVRTIVPTIYQGSLADGVDNDFGIGDVTQSFFFSSKEPVGGWILAIGPVALWPTGTDPGLRSEQLGLGPTALALRQHDGWTYGILANHIFGVTESDDHPDVNATFLQPFLSYTWPTATTLTLNTESLYDWTGEQWTVPVNLLVSQLVKLGSQPVQFFIGGRYYVEAPEEGPEWGIRFGFTLLFPR